jgi:TolB-like protein
VLRLADDGTDESAYLARAVADELVDLLAAVPRLRVMAGMNRSGSAAPSVGARDAGRALGADVVVTGELVREQDIVHVTLRAVTVDDGFRLWTRSFSSPLTEILQRTHDAAASVAKIFEPNDVEIATRPAPDAGALDLYLRGRHLYATSFFDVDAAIEAFAEAHQRAPSDGRIAAAYALALMRRHMLFPTGRADAEQVRRLAGQALASIPGLAAPHVVLAALHYDDGEHRSTALELRRALDAEPNNADALDLLGILLLEGGQPGRAIETLRRAMQADPSRATLDATLARAYELIGDSATADELVGGFRPPARDATRVWLARARLAVWRRDPAAAQRWLDLLAVSPPLPEVAHERVMRTLRVARDRDPALAAEAYLDAAPALARRAAFVLQINVELLVAVGEVALAEQKLGELETLPFFDLTWLDACPLLAELRGSQTFAVLRRSTAARVARALEAL